MKSHDLVPNIHESCPRDQEVDEWFDARFESMKEDVEEETPMSAESVVAMPDTGHEHHPDEDEVDEDDPLAAMMNMEGML